MSTLHSVGPFYLQGNQVRTFSNDCVAVTHLPGMEAADAHRIALRDAFAAAAVTGLIGRAVVVGDGKVFSEDAYRVADCMLKERANEA